MKFFKSFASFLREKHVKLSQKKELRFEARMLLLYYAVVLEMMFLMKVDIIRNFYLNSIRLSIHLKLRIFLWNQFWPETYINERSPACQTCQKQGVCTLRESTFCLKFKIRLICDFSAIWKKTFAVLEIKNKLVYCPHWCWLCCFWDTLFENDPPVGAIIWHCTLVAPKSELMPGAPGV